MTTERPRLTVREAAEAAGVSTRTLRRRLADGAFPGAVRDEGDPLGAWRIPVEDLLAAGFALYATAPEAEPTPTVGHDQADELARLRNELELERVRRQAAEEVADVERARADAVERALEAATLALRALVPPEVVAEDPAPEISPQRRRRWFRTS